jgi:hypothetical protein
MQSLGPRICRSGATSRGSVTSSNSSRAGCSAVGIQTSFMPRTARYRHRRKGVCARLAPIENWHRIQIHDGKRRGRFCAPARGGQRPSSGPSPRPPRSMSAASAASRRGNGSSAPRYTSDSPEQLRVGLGAGGCRRPHACGRQFTPRCAPSRSNFAARPSTHRSRCCWAAARRRLHVSY